jgi:predicted transcriptional regulator
MNDDITKQPKELIALTSKIASAYLSNHTVPKNEISDLLQSIHGTIIELYESHTNGTAKKLEPVVPVEDSITPDFLICLEDGKKLKLLKRYLRTKYNLSPEDYRQKWGLPNNYPMVSPNYAKRRSSFAKDFGLGKKTGD